MDELTAIESNIEKDGASSKPQPPRKSSGVVGVVLLKTGAILFALIAIAGLTVSYIQLTKIGEREKAVAQKEQGVAELVVKKDTLNSEVASIEGKLLALKEEVSQQEAKYENNKKLLENYYNAVAYRDGLMEQTTTLKAEAESLNSVLPSLRDEKKQLDAEASGLANLIAEANKSYSEKQDLIKALDAKIREKQQELNQAESELAKANSALVIAKENLEAEETELKNVSGKLADAQKEIASLRVGISSNVMAVTQSDEAIKMKALEAGKLAENISTLEKQEQALKSAVAKLQGEKDSMQSEIAKYSREAGGLKAETDRLSAIEKKIAEEQGNLEAALQEQKSVAKNVSSLQSQKIELEAEIKRLEEKSGGIAATQKELERLSSAVKMLQSELEALRSTSPGPSDATE